MTFVVYLEELISVCFILMDFDQQQAMLVELLAQQVRLDDV